MRAVAIAILVLVACASPATADPRTPAERQSDAAIISKLSPGQRAKMMGAWNVVLKKGVAEMPSVLINTLYENGMGGPLEREAMRFAKSDPLCEEFRSLTGCKSDTQYRYWGTTMQNLRIRALTIVRDAKKRNLDPRDIPQEHQQMIRNVGGNEWIANAGK